MSATGRSDVRRKDDFYRTPAWCVHRLLEEAVFPEGIAGGTWLDPCAGDGAIIKACQETGRSPIWNAIEIRAEERDHLTEIADVVYCPDDFLKMTDESLELIDVIIITNPPYSLAMEFIERSLRLKPCRAAFLLRLNFLASEGRSNFMRMNSPDVYVLPNRPSFTEDGATDATEYAWFVWDFGTRHCGGKIKVLATTPKSER